MRAAGELCFELWAVTTLSRAVLSSWAGLDWAVLSCAVLVVRMRALLLLLSVQCVFLMQPVAAFGSAAGLCAPARQASSSRRLQMELKRFTSGQACFWGPQERLSKIAGVQSCVAGYTGGSNETPTYKSVCAGDGHVEAVQVVYDTNQITFGELLEDYLVYWRSQSYVPRKGSQYAPCLWVETKEEMTQARAALTSEELEQHTIALRGKFWSAEGWHQFYERKQRPRNVLLTISVALNLLPGISPELHETGVALTILYIAITLGERVLQSKVVQSVD